MPEYWLTVDYVGFKRAFVTGRIPGHEEFELELNDTQKRMLEDFNFEQQQALQKFLQDGEFLDAED